MGCSAAHKSAVGIVVATPCGRLVEFICKAYASRALDPIIHRRSIKFEEDGAFSIALLRKLIEWYLLHYK